MDTKEPRSGDRPARVSPREYADALGDVMRDEERKKAAATGPSGSARRRTSPMMWLVFSVLCVVSGYLWLASPGFLRPAPPRPLPASLVEAGLRVEVALQARRIEAYREREGRLPVSLQEAGNPFTTVRYVREDAQSYRLSADQEGIHVGYSSGESLESFLGDARQVILGGAS